MIVGMWRVLSNIEPGTERTNSVAVEPGIFTLPPYAMTVVAGNPDGKICAVDCATVTVYSLRMICPLLLRTTVGAYVRGTVSWFANCGIVVGSRGTWLTEGVPTACVSWLTSSASSAQPTGGSATIAIPARVLGRSMAKLDNIILFLLLLDDCSRLRMSPGDRGGVDVLLVFF